MNSITVTGRAPCRPNALRFKIHLQADVVVIGGGFTGLSAAYYLTQSLPAKKVVLLEASRCANGASGRNGAMVLNLKHTDVGDPEVDRRMYQLTV